MLHTKITGTSYSEQTHKQLGMISEEWWTKFYTSNDSTVT